MQEGVSNSNSVKLKLYVPLFIASLVSLFIGAPILGLTGIWGFIVQGKAVPHYLKTLHAHVSWWSLVLLTVSMVIQSVSLKASLRKIITPLMFAFPILYPFFLIMNYLSEPISINLGMFGEYFVTIYGFGAFISEVLFFAISLTIIFLAAGLKIKALQTEEDTSSKYDIGSEISIDRKVFTVYGIFLGFSAILGIYILSMFNLQHKPIQPAALVQFHSHTGIFSVGFFMLMLAMRAIGANEKIISLAFNLGTIALIGNVIGFSIFILLNTHSISWIIPASIYLFTLILTWISLLGKFGIRKVSQDDNHFNYIRWALIVLWAFMMVYATVGPYLSLRYDTNPNLTVTYKQPDGGLEGKHVGPYPDLKKGYLGTAPVKGTPRGLENLHLSPGSWSHTAILWLLVLMLFGKQIFRTIGAPNLIFAIAVTIVIAPIANSIGRFGAWADLPGGIGPLYLFGHPLKVINILSLIIISTIFIVKVRKSKA